MAEPRPSRLHVIIEGRVQGVGFRYFVIEKALPLQLTGWVRNTSQGSVEVLAEGDRGKLESFLQEIRTGPRAAFVTGVQPEWSDATGEFSRFSVGRAG